MVNQTLQTKAPSTDDLDPRLSGDLDISVKDLIAEVYSRSKEDTHPEGAFTLKQFMAEVGCSKSTAQRILSDQVSSGFLCHRVGAYYGHSRVGIYWRNLDSPPSSDTISPDDDRVHT